MIINIYKKSVEKNPQGTHIIMLTTIIMLIIKVVGLGKTVVTADVIKIMPKNIK